MRATDVIGFCRRAVSGYPLRSGLMLLAMAIKACKKAGKYIGICGQGPSDHPDLARWLMDQGIDSISLNPDTVVETWLFLAGEPVRAAP